jgi:hypothetical protein
MSEPANTSAKSDNSGFARWFIAAFCLSVLGLTAAESAPPGARTAILKGAEDSFAARLAARELRRYLYLRTGLLPVRLDPGSEARQVNCNLILLLKKNDPALARAGRPEVQQLAAQQYLLRGAKENGRAVLRIIGGDDAGLLYGAYRFCELLGVRFYLHGDVVPDQPLAELPLANETGQPLFSIRGILPFHDFPEGPDWWNRDDFLSYVAQLPKLRLNFLGLHCYPEGHPHAEPLVWIGLPEDQGGAVKHSYLSLWANTGRPGAWGYAAMRTGDFTGGAAQLFATDDYGHEIQAGLLPVPETPPECNALFDRAGALLHDAFGLARRLGVKTCLGTETPLTIPRSVQARLRELGKDPKDPAVARQLYEGMFRRIQNTHNLDYYWLWTPEWWTWEDTQPEQFDATARDLEAARAALQSLGDPFTLATSGWVLGPANDRAALDKILPKNCPMSCINREVGHDLVEAGFAALQGRPKWSIPWLENDPDLTAVQLWAGRMRYDAVDSRKLGCTGLIGIHWRTKVIAPNLAALAAAAWDQSFAPAQREVRVASRGKGPLGGKAYFSRFPVAGTRQSILYQWMRDNLEGYDLDVPNGTYTVTLKFNEPSAAAPGLRVFGVKLQGRAVLDHLDIFDRVGQHRALDLAFPTNRVTDGHLRLEFVRLTGAPCVSAIVIEGATEAGQPMSRKVKCGFDALGDYERDGFNDKPGTVERARALPIEDFYIDFARANFGEDVAQAAGRLFARLDGLNLPQPAHWERGPGAINPLPPADGEYQFVGDFEALRARVRGAGNLARFDYWLNTFRYMRALAAAGGLRAELDGVMARLLKQDDPAKEQALAREAVGVRVRLARAWEAMMSCLVAATDTPGELGTIANLEQHSRSFLGFLSYYDRKLADVLGQPLPPEVAPGKSYLGPARLIVPTVRGAAAQSERLNLRVIAIDERPVARVELHSRTMGQGAFTTIAAKHVGRAVFQVALPSGAEDLEYYLTAVTAAGTHLTWPATAPSICQTVITLP